MPVNDTASRRVCPDNKLELIVDDGDYVDTGAISSDVA